MTSDYLWSVFIIPFDPGNTVPETLFPTKLEVDITIHCRVIAFLPADTSRDFVTLTFDLLTLNSCYAWGGHVTNLATKFEDPMPISSWFMSHKVSRWLPLKMRTRPLRMRQITWPVCRGSKQLHFWYAGPRFAYWLCNFGGSTMKVIKVICENNARPCVKRSMIFCACVKPCDLLKVP